MSSAPEIALEIARALLDLVVKLVPAPAARQMLDDAVFRQALAIGELADDVKFGPPAPSTKDK